MFFARTISWKGVFISTGVFLLGLLPWLPILVGRVSNVAKEGTWLSRANYSELYGFFNKFLNDKFAFELVYLIPNLSFIFINNKPIVYASSATVSFNAFGSEIA